MNKNLNTLTTKILSCIILIASISYYHSASAARFENLSIEHGLSQNTVFDIEQDPYGRLWIATYDGLNLYDGIKFTHFSSKPNKNNAESLLASNSVYDINPDENGNLWLATLNGLTYLDIHTFKTKHFYHDKNNNNSLVSNTVRATIFDSQKNLWVATYGGLSKYDPKNNVFTTYLDAHDSASGKQCPTMIRTIHKDTQGYIWIGDAHKGICRLDPQTEKIEKIDYRNNPRDSFSIGIRSFYQDSAEEIWIGSTQGLYRYHIESGQSKAFKHNPNDKTSIANDWVQKIITHNEQKLWIATSRGLSLFDKNTGAAENFEQQADSKSGLSSNSLFTLLQDKSGLLWVGTESTGIDKYNPRQTQFVTYNQSGELGYKLSSQSVWSVIKVFGYIWLATAEGLNRINPNDGKVKVYQHDPNNKKSIISNYLYRVVAGNNRHIWVSSSIGISRLNVDQETFENYQNEIDNPNSLPFNNIISIKEDSNNNLLLGSYGDGFALINFHRNIYELYQHKPDNPDSINSDFVNDIIEQPDGRFLIATRNGLNRFDIETKKFEQITKNILPENTLVTSVRLTKNNDIIITSANGLFIFYSDSKKLKKYTVQDGLMNDYVYSAEEDRHGNLWISTNHGISTVNPRTNKIKNFDVFDGLQGYEFNSSGSFNDGEYLYFGGFEGLNYFKPDAIIIGDYVPPIIITDFTLPSKQYKVIDFKKPINISYKDTYFSIEFSALDFTNPKKNQYMYKLEGYDEDWIYSGNRNYSSYTNLDGGRYTFRVKGANKYGIWNEQGASIDIIVTPPFWKTPWFRSVMGIALLCLIIAIYWLRVRAVHDHNRVLAEEVKIRTADLEKTLFELGETKDALIEAAHKAGMADSATGVLHNVGNILNSVNTSANIIRDTIKGSVSNKFLRANKLLLDNINNIEEFITSNPKGKTLINYYLELDNSFRKENNKLVENAARLIKNITSIKETIAAQHRYAKGHDLIEELFITNIIDDTLLLQSGSINRHEIKIIKNYDQSIPKIPMQKIKLVQILLNLYKNAKESMDENKSAINYLTITTYQDQDHAYIKVSDTGLGIDSDKLEKIFSHGYTTKTEGYGFGLHNCANYMAEMHGEMWAESKGYGLGATFILKFPLRGKPKKAMAS